MADGNDNVIDLRDGAGGARAGHRAPASATTTVIDIRDTDDDDPDTSTTTVLDLRDPVEVTVVPDGGATLDERTHRAWRIAAVVSLAVLNVFDLITTNAFMRAGVPEGNPIAALGLEQGWVGPFKALVLVVLLARVLQRPPRLGSTCFMWFVTGLYAMTICVNLMIVRGAGGSLF